MREISKALLTSLLILSASHVAHATGNVLLPSSTNDTQTTPNLGIAPLPDTSTTITQPIAPTPVPSASTAPLPYTPPTPPITASIPSSVRIMQIPAHPPSTPDPSAANALSFDLDPHYVWNKDDLQKVNTMLGIPLNKVASSCLLSFSGLVKDSKNVSNFNSSQTPHADIRYNGQITNLMFRAYALCNQVPLPASTTYILQIGDKFAVPLSTGSCPPSNAQHPPKQALITNPLICTYRY